VSVCALGNDVGQDHSDFSIMTPIDHSFDADTFRRVLGHFATGVTVITTCDANGRYIGVTASSFNSVSLDPPLVLWSLARQSSSHAAFASARYWAVHVLSEAQETLSRRFSSRDIDRFDGLDRLCPDGGIARGRRLV